MRERILVLVGDKIAHFVQATGALQDIRQHHDNANITLLAHRTLKKLVETCPWIDDVSYDAHMSLWPNPLAHIRHRFQMQRFLTQFDHIYDFQHDQISAAYLKLDDPNKWNSIHQGAKHRISPMALQQHPLVDIFSLQLSLARLPTAHRPDITYLAQGRDKDILNFYELRSKQYVVLIPGSRQQQIVRRWPYYLELGHMLKRQGVPVVIVGSRAEEKLVNEISQELNAPLLYNPDWPQLVAVFQNARYVIGNDTGPFYMAIACGATGTILYGPDRERRQQRHAPKNPRITVLQHADSLAALSPQQVIKTVL